jgi:hypothetical protein
VASNVTRSPLCSSSSDGDADDGDSQAINCLKVLVLCGVVGIPGVPSSTPSKSLVLVFNNATNFSSLISKALSNQFNPHQYHRHRHQQRASTNPCCSSNNKNNNNNNKKKMVTSC